MQDLRAICESTRDKCAVPFRDLITKLNCTSDEPRVTPIVSDGTMTFTLKNAEELGIPEIVFWPAGACGFMAFVHFRELIRRGLVPLKEDCKMEKAWVWWCCLLAMAILAPRSQAQDTTCMTQLIPCLNYLNSTSSRPSSDCCDPLRSVIKSNPQCLCNMISSNTAASGESSINVTQAMLLPSRCGVSINAATCAAANVENYNQAIPDSR
ncbi:hypothetical protein AAC387_Pa01g3484 [Persea americana]